MKVQTQFEVNHFKTFVNTNALPVKMTITDVKDGFFITKVNGEEFEVHEDVLTDISIACRSMKIESKIFQ